MINQKAAFATGYNYQKVALEGIKNVTVPQVLWDSNSQPIAYAATVVIPHNLGVIPTARVFANIGGFMCPFPMPYGGFGSIDGTPSAGTILQSFGAGPFSSVLVDAVNLTLRITNRIPLTLTYDIYWRLYYDTAN